MTWLQRYRVSSFFRNAVWFPPLVGMLAALLAFPLVQWVDLVLGWKAPMGADGAAIGEDRQADGAGPGFK